MNYRLALLDIIYIALQIKEDLIPNVLGTGS